MKNSEYNKFILNHISKNNSNLNVNKWDYPDTLNENDRNVYEDIFKKFNKYNKFGIGKVATTDEKGAMGAYSFEGDMEKPQSKADYSYFQFPNNLNAKKNPYIPAPKTMAHEVVHANDHQIDGLTPKIWEDLKALREKVENDNLFNESINKLKNKIDFKVFGMGDSYKPDSVLDTINSELNQYKEELPTGNWNASNYKKTKDKFQQQKYGWDNGLSEMQKLTSLENTRQDNKGNKYTIPNYHFKGTFASEFPAFALTNLNKSWQTNKQTGTNKNPIHALNGNEQEFLHNMLGHARNAYPQKEYPSIYNAITDRRHSIERTPTWGNRSKSPTNPYLPQQNNMFGQSDNLYLSQQNNFKPNVDQVQQNNINTKRSIANNSLVTRNFSSDNLLANDDLKPMEFNFTPSQVNSLSNILPDKYSFRQINPTNNNQ